MKIIKYLNAVQCIQSLKMNETGYIGAFGW